MRNSADDAQRVIDQATAKLGNFDVDIEAVREQKPEGSMQTLDSMDELMELAESSMPDSDIDISRDIDTEIMDEVYSALRTNADRRNDGYNQFRGLAAVEKGINPAMITGAKPETVDSWYEKFRDAGLTYTENGDEMLTTEGEIFMDEAYGFLDAIGKDQDTREVQEYIAEAFGSFSRRASNQEVPLTGFIYAADEEPSTSRIAEASDVSKRTVYNWMEKWNGGEGLGFIRGEPRDRKLTGRGLRAYEMVENQHRALDVASEMKASMIEELEEDRTGSDSLPFIPGNQQLVERYLDDSSLAEKYMERN
ncbi:hypothetical protein GKQ38_01675 [Candidatus Nanohaloarchaea archaeon]|nr:hypothetical protein GKQ38_01675 [Candidatus Nanohaloarchaea archaeon]